MVGQRYFLILAIPMFILPVLIPAMAAGCHYSVSGFQEVREGDIARYEITVTNFRKPLGVHILIDVEQDSSTFQAVNREFHLDLSESKILHIYVFTDHPDLDLIITYFTLFQREVYEDQYYQKFSGRFETTIIHDQPEQGSDHVGAGSNMFLGILTLTLMGVFIAFLHHFGRIEIPFLRGYTKLRKDGILRNETRNGIYRVIAESGGAGLTVAGICREVGLHYNSLARFHVNVLLKNGYVRKSGSRYHLRNIASEPPLIDQIRSSIEDGARNPAEVARDLGVYYNRVRREKIGRAHV